MSDTDADSGEDAGANPSPTPAVEVSDALAEFYAPAEYGWTEAAYERRKAARKMSGEDVEEVSDMSDESVQPTPEDMARDLVADLAWINAMEERYKDGLSPNDGWRIAVVRAMAAEAKLAETKLVETYCAYCDHTERADADASRISEHIRTCEKHPMRAVEAEVARLRAKYEPPAWEEIPTYGGGTYVVKTGIFRVPLAVWLLRGPQWVRDFVGGTLTRVELTDKEPICEKWGEGRAWFWDSAFNFPVPSSLFRHLLRGGDGPGVRRWPTEEEAIQAASDALIAWAKEQEA